MIIGCVEDIIDDWQNVASGIVLVFLEQRIIPKYIVGRLIERRSQGCVDIPKGKFNTYIQFWVYNRSDLTKIRKEKPIRTDPNPV